MITVVQVSVPPTTPSGIAAISATNGTTTNPHSPIRMPIGCFPSVNGFGADVTVVSCGMTLAVMATSQSCNDHGIWPARTGEVGGWDLHLRYRNLRYRS